MTRPVLRTAAGLAAAALVVPFVAAAWRSALGRPLPWPLHVVLIKAPAIFSIHMGAAASALLLVPLAVASACFAPLHRAIGRLAALAIAVGGSAALAVAPLSVATPAARAGFFAQGIVWLGLAAAGVIAIRQKRRAFHAALMTATAIVTLAPVLLRIALSAAVRHRWPFAPIYAALAWGSWLLPLALYAVCRLWNSRRPFNASQLTGALQTAAPEYENSMLIG